MEGRARELIELLRLAPHPEGGHYREIFRSSRRVESERLGERSAVTTIYFLLAGGEHSRWHRIGADEIWHFYEGEPLEIFIVAGDHPSVTRQILGPPGVGAIPVVVVPGRAWQAARPRGAYALVGCSVAPGFEFSDFEMLADRPEERESFSARFPELAELI